MGAVIVSASTTTFAEPPANPTPRVRKPEPPPPPKTHVVGKRRVDAVKLDAARIEDAAIKLDGRVDEPAWMRIPTLPPLIQIDPRFGYDPTLQTEVRVAYGEDGLYLAFVCFDDPKNVLGQVARKDNLGASDRVWVEFDANNDNRTGYMFMVNPAGSQEDAQISRDSRFDGLWDGVWQAAATITETGWSAEMKIPWSTIRFDAKPEHTFGINVGRWVNWKAENAVLSPVPQGMPGILSYALDYRGVKDIEPGLNLELRPYISTRIAAQRPDGTLDHSWPVLPNGGMDLKYGLRGNLTLDLTVNPDFGQAEVDPAVLNLGPFEVFFPERRQFFLESKELFETRFDLFYSRRVGAPPPPSRAKLSTRGDEEGELVRLDPQTRLFGAMRLTGQLTPTWSVGALTANAGPTYGVEQFSDGSQQPVDVTPTTQFSVLRVRKEFTSQTNVGGILTAVNRGGGEVDAYTGGFDYQLQFRKRWLHTAQVIGTHDGERGGMGAQVGLVRSGKNIGLGLAGEMLTPHANFNDLGYMRFANYVETEAVVEAYNAQPVGNLRRLYGSVSAKVQSSFEGHLTEKRLHTEFGLMGLNQWQFSTFFGGHLPQLDLYETRGNIPYEVPFHWWTGGRISSPDTKRVVGVLRGDYGEQAGYPGPSLGTEISLRPVDRLQLTGSFDFASSFFRPRWVAESDAGVPVFARARVINLTGVLRATVGILPTLTLQTYNQLVYATARHNRFLELPAPDVLVPLDELQAAPYSGEVDQGLTSMISNTILRWEYLPGSFLFAVFTHRTVLSEGGMVAFSGGRGFSNLVHPNAQSEDIIFIKLVHLFGL